MKKKTTKMKVKKEVKSDCWAGFVLGLLLSVTAVGLFAIGKMAYNDVREPDFQECYVNSSGLTFVQVDSVFNDENVSYNYADLRDDTLGFNRRDTDSFLEMYSKTDCQFFHISRGIIKLQGTKQ